jgi:hypothetical protein
MEKVTLFSLKPSESTTLKYLQGDAPVMFVALFSPHDYFEISTINHIELINQLNANELGTTLYSSPDALRSQFSNSIGMATGCYFAFHA